MFSPLHAVTSEAVKNYFMQLNKSLTLYVSIICFGSIITASCNNDKDAIKETGKPETDTATMQPAQSIALEDSAMLFTNKADNWISKSLHKSIWNWSRFQLAEFWYEDSLKQNPYETGARFYVDYAPLLKWSPDSSYLLDVGTIGATLIKDKTGKTSIADGDIDTEISMCYPKTKMRSRMLYFGSGSSLINATWLNNDQVAILGAVHETGPQPDTILWIINAKENYFRKYKWK